jgi:hypothetical protein
MPVRPETAITGAAISCFQTDAMVLNSLNSEIILLQIKIVDIARSN